MVMCSLCKCDVYIAFDACAVCFAGLIDDRLELRYEYIQPFQEGNGAFSDFDDVVARN